MAEISGQGIPTNQTAAAIGDIYTDTDTGQKYKCDLAYASKDEKGNDFTYYIWIKLKNESSGSGGTTDYTNLTNKPQINSVDLVGNKTSADLSLLDETAVNKLKEDLDYKIDKTAVGEIELKFTNIGYVNASDGTISMSKEAQNTGFCRIDGVSRIIAHVNLSEAGAKIAFYSRNKEYLKDISIIPAITDPNYTKTDLDITSDVYANAKYCIVSNYGSTQKIAKSNRNSCTIFC